MSADPHGKAWMAQQYLVGRTQIDIAVEIGTSSSAISQHLKQFCREWTSKDVTGIYDDERKKYLLAALRHWFMQTGCEPTHPLANTLASVRNREDYGHARYEHAWLLRAEGMTFRAIGRHLGISGSRANQMVWKFSRRVKRAMNHCRWKLENE